jgi:major vault protein
MNERRERELVLAPNEFAYILDTTKGLIACYVGPNKTSLAQTDQPVWLNPETGRFEPAELAQAVTLFVTAASNAYVVLDNPAKDDSHPRCGLANSLMDLELGCRINVPGPISFALWPGQVAQVIGGHRLRTNEYLVVRVHNAETANAHWRDALGLPAETEDDARPEPFVVGDKRIIRGSEVKFYIPPTGLEVVPGTGGLHVRQAVSLQKLEYCVLLGERGGRRYVQGERVVFPEPDQRFLVRGGRRSFRAIELSDTTALHVKVIADHADAQGNERKVGDELFLTGDGVIFFPREELVVLPAGDQDLHQAVAIPRGEGRYVLNRESGEVLLVKGPRMFLPDPRQQVVTRRVLSDRECALLYPDNAETLAFNRSLRATGRPPRPRQPKTTADGDGRAAPNKSAWTGPPSITLDNRLDGAVRVEVWSSFAVQVVDRAGNRRVERGPRSILLAFDEMLQPLALSTGTPKSADTLLHTAFLQVHGNKVTDQIEVVTQDMVRARVTLTYRVGFEGDDPSRWFAVDNYVKLLCDHASSMIKSRVRQETIRSVQSSLAPTIRDLLLGERAPEGGRPGLVFPDNDMRVRDVEVLDIQIDDPAVAEMLAKAQTNTIRQAIDLAARETDLARLLRVEEIGRQLDQERHDSQLLRLELKAEQAARAHAEAQAKQTREAALQAAADQLNRDQATLENELLKVRIDGRRAGHAEELEHRKGALALELEDLAARVEAAVGAGRAFDPHLVHAIQRLGDQELLGSLAENFGELSAVEGRGLLETARKFLDFVPSTLVPSLHATSAALPAASDGGPSPAD